MPSSAAFAALRDRWWFPLVGLLLGVCAALAVSLAMTPLYSSQTQLFVSTTGSTSAADVFQGSQFSQQRVGSYAQLLAGERLADRIVDRLDLAMTPGALAEEITAKAVTGTVLIDVTVTDPSPDRAHRIADAIGDEFPKLVAELETPDGAAISPVKVTVSQSPSLPEIPSQPQTTQNAVLGGLAGLVLGFGVAVARGRLDRSVRDAEEITALTGVPVIGTVVRDDVLAKQHVVDRAGSSRTAEDFRQLRTNLQFVNIDEPPKVIMVSSAMPSEGKTTATINLALTLAEAGHRVTVVEADLRRPQVTRYLGLVGGVGLTTVLAGTAGLDEVLQRYGPEGITVLGSGPIPPNPGELLASSHMAALLDKLRGANDFVLVDAPPLLPVADSTGLAVHVDGVLLSVRYAGTTKEQLRQAAATLERVHATILGVIFNIVPPNAGTAAQYGYGYGYGPEQGVRTRRIEPPSHRR